MLPSMKGGGLQKYAFFPTVLKVREYFCPFPKRPELNDPFFAVAVCWALSLLIQMTFVPGLMVMLAGLNLNPWIKTGLVGCFCAPAADESARPAPPTSPSVPSFKNSLRVIAMQLPPYGLRGRCTLHLGACLFSGAVCYHTAYASWSGVRHRI